MVDRTLRRIFILSGIALILWVLYLLKPVVLPFITAFLVAYLFSPLVDKLHRIGLPRWLSIGIVYRDWCDCHVSNLVCRSTGLATADLCTRQYSRRYSLVELPFYRGCRRLLMLKQWRLILNRSPRLSWNIFRPIIVPTAFRVWCYVLHNRA